MTKKIRRHWNVILWQIPLLLPFALIQFLLDVLTVISWIIYSLVDASRIRWQEFVENVTANLPHMYSRENNTND